jgi:hypothetical protein
MMALFLASDHFFSNLSSNLEMKGDEEEKEMV